MPLVDLGPAPVKKKDTGLIDLGPAPTPISEALTAVEQPVVTEPAIAEPIRPPIEQPMAFELPADPLDTALRGVAELAQFEKEYKPTFVDRAAMAAARATGIPKAFGVKEAGLAKGALVPSPEELKKMPWYKKMPEYAGWTAETIVELATLHGIFKSIGFLQKLPKSATAIDKAVEMAKWFGGTEAIRQAGRRITQQDSEGATAILKSAGIGFAFSLGLSGAGVLGRKLFTPTEKKLALRVLGLKKGATEPQIRQAMKDLGKKVRTGEVSSKDYKTINKLYDRWLKRQPDIVYRRPPTEAKPTPRIAEITPTIAPEAKRAIIKAKPPKVAPVAEGKVADLSKRADAAFKQNDLDAMQAIVQESWELPETPETKALKRRIQILDGEMVARRKPPTPSALERKPAKEAWEKEDAYGKQINALVKDPRNITKEEWRQPKLEQIYKKSLDEGVWEGAKKVAEKLAREEGKIAPAGRAEKKVKLPEYYVEPAKPKLVDLGPAKEKEFEIEPGKFYTQAKIEEAITKGEMGEIEIEPALETKSSSFNKHIEYFQGRQLPETSQIRKIQKQMQIVNGKRLAGTITAQEANKKIQQLRKVLFETAQKEGIALRMTKGGKVSVAVRKAGTYVPVEFAEYGKFKNVRPLGQDVTRSIQQIDGALPIKEKVRMKGQAGATERNVLWPTREISKQKLEYIKEKSVQLKKVFKTKAGTKEDAQINIILEKIAKADRNKPIKDVLSAKTIKAMAVKPSVVKQAVELRKFYDDLIEEQNIARRIRGQDPIPYRRNYSPHILRDTTIWERLMMRGQKPEQIFGKKADLPDYIKPNKPFNPRELAREAGIPYEKRVKSATELAQSYLVTASKDIFNTSIIQNNKAFIQQLDAMGYDKPARYLGDWTAESYAGIKPALDRTLQLTQLPRTQRGMRRFNRIRNLAVFPLNLSWNLLTQTSSLALTVGRYGTINTAKGFYQWLKPSIRKQTAQDYYSFVVKSTKQGKITKQDAQNLIGESIQLRKTRGDLVRDFSVFLLEQLERILTGTSIRAAHLHGSKRGLTGEALKNYASDGGAKTQSMYNDEDKPALLRNLSVKTTLPYQTFAYEVMNTLREWAGTTGTPPDTKLYTIWSVLRFLAAATVFASIAKKGANKDVWSWKRPPIPFAELWLSPIIKRLTGEYIHSASGLTSPIETASRIADGLEDVFVTGSWRKLRNELIKYGPGVFGIPGGVQWARTVDAIIAYSQGGLKDRRGRMLFKMEKPRDLIQGIFGGVWTTKGGREYIKKRAGKSVVQKVYERVTGEEPTRMKRKTRMEREKRMLRK